ncbi:hypothetical protein ACI78Q_00310 [Geodermatophilus sp. SYSU D00705]
MSVPERAFELRLPDVGVKVIVTTSQDAARYAKTCTAGVYLRCVEVGGVLVVYVGTSRAVCGRQAGHSGVVDWVLFLTRADAPEFAFGSDDRKAIEYWLAAAAGRAQGGGRVRCGNGTAPEDPGLSPEIVAAIRRPVLAALQAVAHPAAAPGLHDLVEAAAELLDITAASAKATIRPRPTSRGHGPGLVKQLMAHGLLDEGDRLYSTIRGVRQDFHVRRDGKLQDGPLGSGRVRVFRSVTGAYDAHRVAVRKQLPADVTLSEAARRSGVEALKVDGGRFPDYSLAALRRLLP